MLVCEFIYSFDAIESESMFVTITVGIMKLLAVRGEDGKHMRRRRLLYPTL